jgi:trk system potassium uptake protein TrkH
MNNLDRLVRIVAASRRLVVFGYKRFGRMVRKAWWGLRPPQQLVLGFASYAIIGVLLLALPIAQQQSSRFIDNLFNVVSALSTTGLTTVSVSDHYSWFGEFVILALFQCGGIGYMTLSSVIMLARGKRMSARREGVLKAGFALPHYFVMRYFLVHVVVFTFVTELIGAAILSWHFAALGVEQPIWSGVFHSVSAFATAGFSLNNDSLERFAGDWVVNLTISVLAYLGAIGFIVVQDVWYSLKWRERVVTFTSKVILSMTAIVFVLGTLLFFVVEPSVSTEPWPARLMQAAFQVMTASTTAGFNTIPVGTISQAGLLVIMLAMLIGASPSGTGGGMKTTTISALLGTLWSVVRGRDRVVWLNREVPVIRVVHAVGSATIYLCLLALGVFALSITESNQQFLLIVFEAASAIGTVGLSMGITGELSVSGKLLVIILMFAGRCGPLTLGLALLRPQEVEGEVRGDDLAI